MVAKTNGYKTEMYFVKENGEEVLLGYVDWSQDERALREAGGAFFAQQAYAMEDFLVDRFIKFTITKNGPVTETD